MTPDLVYWIPLIPFLGAAFLALAGRRLPRALVSVIGCGTVGTAFGATIMLWNTVNRWPAAARRAEMSLGTWFGVNGFNVDLGFLVDPLSLTMALVVTGVGFLIHLYSAGYMHDDPRFASYFARLNLFVGSMLVLVFGNNFLVLFAGWELVGLCSYLLIGFWCDRPPAAAAAMKAFVVNRVGDLGFLIALLFIVSVFGTLDYGVVFGKAAEKLGPGTVAATAVALLLFCGAVGKSAQIPLHVWLPDAMEGPTPVSALIHAATMVTAGVYMVARCHPLFELSPLAQDVVAWTGVLTALFAALIALVQTDLKRMLAYSTISQLGTMFVAVGVGAYAAGIFHLVTHAFFKALLFLAAGSVMHALAGEIDMRRLGGLATTLPLTTVTFGIGALALAGVPGLSGFFSKDEILWQALSRGGVGLWAVGALTAFLTAVYVFRAFSLTFLGQHRGPSARLARAHESPTTMTGPLVLLSVGAVIAGWFGVPEPFGGHDLIGAYLSPVFPPAESAGGGTGLPAGAGEIQWMLAAFYLGLIVLAAVVVREPYWDRAGRSTIPRLVWRVRDVVGPWLTAKFYVDELYEARIVTPLLRLAAALERRLDRAGIDAAADGLANRVTAAADSLRAAQSGYARTYGLAMFLGAALLAGLLVFG